MSPESEKVSVVGGGGHAKVVVSCLLAADFPIAGVFDDDPKKADSSILGYSIRGAAADLEKTGFKRAILAIGSNGSRRRLAETLDLEWVTLIHPAAVVDRSARLGPGTVVFAGGVVQPDVTIGSHVIVNTSASIDHDCRIGDFTHIAPGARLAGDVTIGEGVLVGIGAMLAPGVNVGDWATIGAGSVVLEDVQAGDTVAGSPARKISTG